MKFLSMISGHFISLLSILLIIVGTGQEGHWVFDAIGRTVPN